jgi:AcrR family transcriptional regulator
VLDLTKIMRKREDLTFQTRQNIIDAFWELYCENRWEKITVKAITSRAGYNRSTFYEYFKDVYDVLETLELSLIPSLHQIPPISPTDSLTANPIAQFLGFWELNGKYYEVLLGEQGDPAFAIKLKQAIKPLVVEMIVNQPELDKDNLNYFIEYTLSALIGVMNYWFKHETDHSPANILKVVNQLIGFSGPKTKSIIDK